jgi:hypothetical protein
VTVHPVSIVIVGYSGDERLSVIFNKHNVTPWLLEPRRGIAELRSVHLDIDAASGELVFDYKE